VHAAAAQAPRRLEQETERLSLREKEVLRMVANGYTSAEIGARLLISAMTVNTHIKNIYRKLQVRTRAQAVRFASLRGLF
jgi:DNA-binding CsgD family transcriptional regulator